MSNLGPVQIKVHSEASLEHDPHGVAVDYARCQGHRKQHVQRRRKALSLACQEGQAWMIILRKQHYQYYDMVLMIGNGKYVMVMIILYHLFRLLETKCDWCPHAWTSCVTLLHNCWLALGIVLYNYQLFRRNCYTLSINILWINKEIHPYMYRSWTYTYHLHVAAQTLPSVSYSFVSMAPVRPWALSPRTPSVRGLHLQRFAEGVDDRFLG